MAEHCEILVIGSGPGGSVTAATLAEGGRSVTLIEDGPDSSGESCAPFSIGEMEQKYRNGGLTPALGRPTIAYVEGRCVGGGSEINSGLYHRTPPEILEDWSRDYELRAASPAEMVPHFEFCEQALSVGLSQGETPLASRKLAEGAEHLGWKAMEVPRWYRYEGGKVGGEAVRQSMTRTMIPRAMAAGCKLIAGVRAERLRQENGQWTVLAAGLSYTAETVFLAAGAIQTPHLLLRSGIGSNIGSTLAMHPTVKIVARFDEQVNHENLGVPVHQVKEFAPRMSFGCSISSPPHLALAMLDHPSYAQEVHRHWRHLAIYYAMITGRPVGAVRPLPGFSDPLVRYLLSVEDRRDLATGLQRLAQMLFAAGARELYPSISGVPRLTSAAEIRLLPEEIPLGRSSVMTIHLFSSCPMGEDRRRAAVDSFGRVHGLRGLHVADASLLPTAPGVNPQGSVMAFARRNALQFLRESRYQ
jgi:choline dehydrogenase-like flavoprotein